MNKETLDKINALTRRTFKPEELYTFPVVLCHNDIDRDMERFSDDALDKMAELFIGKTGIFDHNPTAGNQSARIYDTEIITEPEKRTMWGGAFRYLKGYAYMVKTDSNADLITEIDAGIKKEVSVSCSTSRRTCSVCGADVGTGCEHAKGKNYDGQICHTVLDGITDAYEWSFVAVPAQVGAGVAKQYTIDKGGNTMEEFTPITTQKDFDAAMQPHIKAAVKQFEDWTSPEDAQILRDQVAALTAERDALRLDAMRKQAAQDAGLPPELAGRIVGEDAQALAEDAQALAKFTKSAHTTPMHFHAQAPKADTAEADLLEMLRTMKS